MVLAIALIHPASLLLSVIGTRFAHQEKAGPAGLAAVGPPSPAVRDPSDLLDVEGT
ncbi:hypothetical protein ACFU7T_00820 [Streptomyces sp. NPDC057555]|uniref:hypothetical protein n=1 Tax=Streptomyces sp. NPDC057555 TaxID=3346166 RepID=UPI0036739584